MKRLVVFSGAGMSAESGLRTFRDSDGLWEQFDINEVATPEAWENNPAMVLDFYNQRRKQVLEANPNAAHQALVELEKHFDVQIITQNIDDLHERAGSHNVLHLHGQIQYARSTKSDQVLYPIHKPLAIGDLAPDGGQLRPHVVWFGEPVPEFDRAAKAVAEAEILIVIGTSLKVYPAAGLIFHAQPMIPMYIVDKDEVTNPGIPQLHMIQDLASSAVPALVDELIKAALV